MRLIIVDAIDLRIMAGCANGLTDEAIAMIVHVSTRTVKNRMIDLRALLGASNRAALAATAVHLGAVVGSPGCWRPGTERAILEQIAATVNGDGHERSKEDRRA